MRITGLKLRSGRIPVLPIFFAGVMAGFFVMNVGRGVLLENTGLFDEYTLYNMKYMTVDNNALFSYVLRERIFSFLALAVLSTTYLGLVVCVGTIVWYGTSVGAFLAALTLRYGLKGIFLAVAAIFPHYLVYVPAMLALLGWCETLYRGIYHRTLNLEEDKTFLFRKLAYLAAVLLAAGVGCLLEAYVSPFILMGYLKVF